MKGFVRTFGVPLGVVAMDQLTKLWVVTSLPFGSHRPVIRGFFDLVHTRNRGIAFGLFSQGGPWSQGLLLVVIVLLVGFVTWQLVHNRNGWVARWGLGLILGGAIGNLLDRLLRREVVDFLDFYVSLNDRAYHWPAFNLADSSITVGAFLLLAFEIFAEKAANRASDPH